MDYCRTESLDGDVGARMICPFCGAQSLRCLGTFHSTLVRRHDLVKGILWLYVLGIIETWGGEGYGD